MPVKLIVKEDSNPYYTIFETFLKRQAILNGTVQVVSHSTLKYTGATNYSFHRANGDPMVTGSTFELDISKPVEVELYKSYLFMSLFAQSFENLEHFLKENVRCHLDHVMPEKKANEIVSKNMFRSNSEAIEIIKSIAPSVNAAFKRNLSFTNIKLDDWFHIVQEIRHCVVHQDQTVSSKLLELIEAKNKAKRVVYDAYFKTDRNESRITTDIIKIQKALRHVSTYAFVILEGMSQTRDYRLNIFEMKVGL